MFRRHLNNCARCSIRRHRHGTDHHDDSIYYYSGYYGYRYMEFGRSTILVVHAQGPTLLTPAMEKETGWRGSLPTLNTPPDRVEGAQELVIGPN